MTSELFQSETEVLEYPLAIEGFERRPRQSGPIVRRRTTAFVRAQFAVQAAGVDLAAVTASALAVGVVYHALFYHIGGMAEISAGLGLAMALLFVVLNALRHEYAIQLYLTFVGHVRRVFLIWNVAFGVALGFMFATKQTASVSRASALLLYVFGLLLIILARAGIVALTRRRAASGQISLARTVLVGSEAELRRFNQQYQPWAVGVNVVASTVLRGDETLNEDLALAAAIARVLHPDDVFLLTSWSENHVIDAALVAFMNVPASIHLGPQRVLDRFTNANVARLGPIATLNLVRHPLTFADRLAKRALDVVVAAALLVVLLPLFAVIALAIRLESRGPAFFVQRRYGFNQQTFRVLKFRSMTVLEDGSALRQAVRGDKRVTRIGRLLRRTSLDELPQLLNVLRGEMSLVGPRPHALAHNQQYDQIIAAYARRHNVKPGITGWAQIHGLRGETASETAMRDRVEHDLFYIDNWSLAFDVFILASTLVSARVFANAY